MPYGAAQLTLLEFRFMAQPTFSGLAGFDPIAFVPIVSVARAKEFYSHTLGLRLLSDESPVALVYDVNGTMVRLAIVKDLPPGRGTVLGWKVPDIQAAVGGLQKAGVTFARYDFMKQDELGVWNSPSGAKVAWFKDPDGNILSLTEFPAAGK